MAMGAWRVQRYVPRRVVDCGFVEFRQQHVGVGISLGRIRRVEGGPGGPSQRSGTEANHAGKYSSTDDSNCPRRGIRVGCSIATSSLSKRTPPDQREGANVSTLT